MSIRYGFHLFRAVVERYFRIAIQTLSCMGRGVVAQFGMDSSRGNALKWIVGNKFGVNDQKMVGSGKCVGDSIDECAEARIRD